MINIGHNANTIDLSEKSFSDRFLERIDNIGKQEDEVIEIIRGMKFGDSKNSISGVGYQFFSLTDDDEKVRIAFKATSGAELIPDSKDKLVRRLRVCSVGTTGHNMEELIHIFKHIND